MPQPIEFFYASTPNGWKIAIALHEMELPFHLNPIVLSKGDQRTPEYLKIAPSGKIPAIIDPEGPDGAPISIFESGAILQYLARKTGRFYGRTERDRITVDQWLMWQMGGLGPIAGQSHHFLFYAPQMDPPIDLPYAKARFKGQVSQLYQVLDRQLAENEFVAGDFYSIADFAIWPWIFRHPRQQQVLEDTPNVKRWYDQLHARPQVQAGQQLAAETAVTIPGNKEAQAALFGTS
ncbi:glutathione S-transferase family protein [Actibacterium sp.]|uniref:glutathione S-transferase family protein n=1 Tax=Actibacterium sp. TaxID=1872125 RepID=UPI00356ACC96